MNGFLIRGAPIAPDLNLYGFFFIKNHNNVSLKAPLKTNIFFACLRTIFQMESILIFFFSVADIVSVDIMLYIYSTYLHSFFPFPNICN